MYRAEEGRQREIERLNAEIAHWHSVGAAYPRGSYASETIEVAIRLAELKREIVIASPAWFWWLLASLVNWLIEVRKICCPLWDRE